MFELSKFNKYREDNRREVKRARNGLPDSLWSTYSTFANCYGGVIILGVEENEDGSWRTTGLQGEEKLLITADSIRFILIGKMLIEYVQEGLQRLCVAASKRP